MKIIKWHNGKYGVRVGNWVDNWCDGYSYVDKDLCTWKMLLGGCRFDTYEEATSILKQYKTRKLKLNNHNKYKVLK